MLYVDRISLFFSLKARPLIRFHNFFSTNVLTANEISTAKSSVFFLKLVSLFFPSPKTPIRFPPPGFDLDNPPTRNVSPKDAPPPIEFLRGTRRHVLSHAYREVKTLVPIGCRS